MENKKKINKTKQTKTKKITSNKVTKKVTKKSNQKKKGFTLIELLAVIIILGILMIIAIPSVTSYISDSRKNAYIDTAKEIVGGARNVVNEGRLGMYDTNTTYYIPADYIKTENASKSPYGEFTEAYVGVVYDGTGYKYYWISTDDAGQGVPNLTLADKLETDDIVSDLKSEDIDEKVKTTGVGDRSNILILQNGQWSSPFQARNYINENGETYNGLTYEGNPIVFSNSDLKDKLDAKCDGENIGEDLLGISFDSTPLNYANVTLNNYFSSKANVNLQTTISIETDAETGESRVVVGECTNDPERFANLDISKFLYNGEPVTRSYLVGMIENQCDEFRLMLESLDTECVKLLINN
jgi:prepilin-type N-terminal cleavage/methylation domain-containing protein